MSIINEIGTVEAAVNETGAGKPNTVTFTDIEKGTVYNYYLKFLVNGVTNYIPVSFVGNNTADENGTDVYPLRVMKGTKNITSLESGKLMLSRIIDNTDGANDFGGLLVAAVYHDDAIIQMTECEKTVLKGDISEIATEIIIPELVDETYELRVFLWDSVEGQNIIRAMKTFK